MILNSRIEISCANNLLWQFAKDARKQHMNAAFNIKKSTKEAVYLRYISEELGFVDEKTVMS